MTKDRTSISITRDLKQELDDAKTNPSESYESLLWRLLETNTTQESVEIDTDELAANVAKQIDYAQIAGQVGDELEGRMR